MLSESSIEVVSRVSREVTPTAHSLAARPIWRSYLELTKPRIVALIVFTSIVGMLLAQPGLPRWDALLWGTLGIALSSACAAVLNHVLDRQIDEKMARTRLRPLPAGRVTQRHALAFACVLGATGSLVLFDRVNALILFLIVFLWTPPHFWSLAIARRREYARTGVPMLPVTHGVSYTQSQVILYTVLMSFATLLPALVGMTGVIYLAGAVVLNGRFLYLVVKLKRRPAPNLPMRIFRYSITYLGLLFAILLLDHYWNLPL